MIEMLYNERTRLIAVLTATFILTFGWMWYLVQTARSDRPQSSESAPSLMSLVMPPTSTPTPSDTPTPTPTETPTPTPTPVIYPSGLSIPSIGIIGAPMEYTGILDDGTMDTPKSPGSVGWLQLGPKPGELGAAIMSGHYDDAGGNPAVFANLRYLATGSEIIVHMIDGSERRFVVDVVGEIDAYGNGIDAITRQTDYPSLTLVTCHGTWDARSGIYSKRLVVYAKYKF